MKKISEHLTTLIKNPLSVIVRTSTRQNAYRVIKNTVSNGFKFVEVTLTVPEAYEVIKQARQEFPTAIIGAGTVLTINDAQEAIKAGAQYLVSPVYSPEILKWSLKNDILYVPGVMTVNEMYSAYNAGAQLLKFYPAVSVPPEAFQLIANPFSNFKILATGGITLENMEAYFKSGILAVGITGKLGGANDDDRDEDIAKLAKQYVKKLADIMKERDEQNGN
ncbi:bifunctional 4-hydroxy-2-oxoglutarate aldolase/2-dehydro-3-deoxy-phosphogluconate aldolase [Spiroplasma endosymbiont of Stenodema calcarata]|uniref:bifunctional 4-hydroxy-2-oxoglutarate aldolase/2-dehydro-3-deoxy-phosphogluconate aldolase n=1 Tax=Spiroplasma endosymbiont of Stenodema calcarata TaxID=3139328 RepID=UPI003CCAEA91